MGPFVVFLCTDKSGSIQLCLSVNVSTVKVSSITSAQFSSVIFKIISSLPFFIVFHIQYAIFGQKKKPPKKRLKKQSYAKDAHWKNPI